MSASSSSTILLRLRPRAKIKARNWGSVDHVKGGEDESLPPLEITIKGLDIFVGACREGIKKTFALPGKFHRCYRADESTRY